MRRKNSVLQYNIAHLSVICTCMCTC